MTPTEELNLVEQQIHTLNEAQKVYPAKGELIHLTLKDPKKCYEYDVTDTWLDLFLDSIILHQTLSDDWECVVEAHGLLVFECGITKECFDKLKKILNETEDISKRRR